ncbi:hypothetical protein [Algoriphagus namhaensis]
MYFSNSLIFISFVANLTLLQGLFDNIQSEGELRKKIVKHLVLDQWPNTDSKEYVGYNLIIFVGEGTVQEVMTREPLFDSQLIPIKRASFKKFKEEVNAEDILPFYGCVLIIPVLHKTDSQNVTDKNLAEGIKSMTPFAEYKDFKCIQFLEPILVNRTVRY